MVSGGGEDRVSTSGFREKREREERRERKEGNMSETDNRRKRERGRKNEGWREKREDFVMIRCSFTFAAAKTRPETVSRNIHLFVSFWIKHTKLFLYISFVGRLCEGDEKDKG
ncbi:hypothetical protein WMY93_010084 [Mugilogobius chulae]|uniref:Uncharacterized protein n=1 Tax=Mugilogobius chulae TaxID=88201 RepID=A0AAW0P6S8_9GOBI